MSIKSKNKLRSEIFTGSSKSLY